MDLCTVEDLVPATQASWQPGDAYLAGGSWLFSERQTGISRLLDLAAFRWPAITVSPAGIEVAATCTLAELAGWSPPAYWPAAGLISQCCRALLGSFKIWNTATVGGNLCLSLAAGPMAALISALHGRCELWAVDGGRRQLPVLEFVTGPGSNVLAPGDLLRRIWLPSTMLTGRTAFRQLSLSPYGRSGTVVIGHRDLTTGELTLTVTAALPRPKQWRFSGVITAAAAVDAVRCSVPAYYADVHGDPAWRRGVTELFVAEVIEELSR